MRNVRQLRAGSLTAVFEDGALRHIRSGSAEVVQLIYVAVRDRNWGTPAGRIENLAVREDHSGFSVTFDSVHQQDELDFRWRGTIEGTARGISFAMDGKAHSTFLRNRIGLCVHHPLRECAGTPCVIETVQGSAEYTHFPEFVEPHQPFRNVRGMIYEVQGVRTEVRFEGEVFETEDHRNWTDANFKTYGTPLDLPYPVEVVAGSEIQQRVMIGVKGAGPAAHAPESPVRVVAESGAKRMPRIGLVASTGAGPSGIERAALQRLRLSHLRVDLQLSGEWRTVLERAAEIASSIGAKLEVAVTLPGDVADLAKWAPAVDRWLVFHQERKSTGFTEALILRQALGEDAVVIVGTNEFFAELNRNRPDAAGWNGACFSLNPQVHVFDDESMMANAAAQFDAVQSARRFLGGRDVIVSPVTLRPRFNPAPDPRQKLPICAAWTIASLHALTEAGASSITYYETHGPGGVVDGSERYPVYRVLERLGQEFVSCASSDPSRVAALAFPADSGLRYLVANLTENSCDVEIEGLKRTLEPYAVAEVQGAQ